MSAPNSLASLTHLNAFSADIAHALHTQGTPPPWTNCNFPTYASAKRHVGGGGVDTREMKRADEVKRVGDRDAAGRRAARQAAARKLREMRKVMVTSSEEGDGSSVSSGGISEEQFLSGVLKKRGGKTKMLMKRWFVLEDATLYNYRSPEEVVERRESWKLNLVGAAVGFDAKNLRIVIAMDGFRTLVLYAESVEDAKLWINALVRAADSGGKVVESAADVDSEKWDSFRSFAKLKVGTKGGWEGNWADRV